jgi:hypothetical protein
VRFVHKGQERSRTPVGNVGEKLPAFLGGSAERVARVEIPVGEGLAVLVGHDADEVIDGAKGGACKCGYDACDAL